MKRYQGFVDDDDARLSLAGDGTVLTLDRNEENSDFFDLFLSCIPTFVGGAWPLQFDAEISGGKVKYARFEDGDFLVVEFNSEGFESLSEHGFEQVLIKTQNKTSTSLRQELSQYGELLTNAYEIISHIDCSDREIHLFHNDRGAGLIVIDNRLKILVAN